MLMYSGDIYVFSQNLRITYDEINIRATRWNKYDSTKLIIARHELSNWRKIIFFSLSFFLRSNNYVTCVFDGITASYFPIVGAVRRNPSTCPSRRVRSCRLVSTNYVAALIYTVSSNRESKFKWIRPNCRGGTIASQLSPATLAFWIRDDKKSFCGDKPTKIWRRIVSLNTNEIYTSIHIDEDEKNIAIVVYLYLMKRRSLSHGSMPEYLFTLSYIRKSGCKHFPTLMSTLHHRSSLIRANSAKLT